MGSSTNSLCQPNFKGSERLRFLEVVGRLRAMEEKKESFKEKLWCLVVTCLLIAFYSMTRALNHSESYDSLNYALFAENFPLGTSPDTRNILFHALNRILLVTSEWLGLNIGALELITSVSIVTGALSVVLFARLMTRRFGVSAFSAWTGATFLGLTYGFWRYTAAAEVYIPSIFLILCSLTLIFKFLDEELENQRTLFAASVLSGIAVLFYQPNIIVLFFATFVLFCSSSRFFSFVRYSVVGALVVVGGLVVSYLAMKGEVPAPSELVSFVTARNGEFRSRPPVHLALIKFVLAFGHDLFSAHWTRTLDPVRTTLDPHIPGCVYNFNVVVYAAKGIQYLTAIAAVLFIPVAAMFVRIHWIASRKWKITRPDNRTLFLIGWMGSIGLIVGTIDPGSFEAWIPVLVPFAGLLTVFVIEPCCQLGKQRTLIAFLLLVFCYNFFGGIMIWRNSQGDYFFHKTAWIRQELTEKDTVLLNEFDYRMVDYLGYYSDARIVHLTGADQVTIDRSHPRIHTLPLDAFLAEHTTEQHRLFVMDDVLFPSPQIKSCRSGEEKFEAATALADRLKAHAVLVDSGTLGKTFQIKPAR